MRLMILLLWLLVAPKPGARTQGHVSKSLVVLRVSQAGAVVRVALLLGVSFEVAALTPVDPNTFLGVWRISWD